MILVISACAEDQPKSNFLIGRETAKLDVETAREAMIAPLRAGEIEKCKTQRNDPAYCERFWADYGDASRGDHGQMMPRMFNDLPECVAATQARNESSRGR